MGTQSSTKAAGAWFSWLERLPVTQEVAGSSPVASATSLTIRFNPDTASFSRPSSALSRVASLWSQSWCLA